MDYGEMRAKKGPCNARARIFLYILFYMCLKYSRAALQGQGCCNISFLFIDLSTFRRETVASIFGDAGLVSFMLSVHRPGGG